VIAVAGKGRCLSANTPFAYLHDVFTSTPVVARVGTRAPVHGRLMVILDASVVMVALPSIKLDLGFSAAALPWVVSGYAVTFGGLLLLGGRSADLLGRRRMFMAGSGLFAIASLFCGLAPTSGALIAARLQKRQTPRVSDGRARARPRRAEFALAAVRNSTVADVSKLGRGRSQR
jgi:Major Facilitator Superfamily